MFIETVTFLGNDALIPINRIKHVTFSFNNGWKISIVSDDEVEHAECFGKDEKMAHARYKQISEILQAK